MEGLLIQFTSDRAGEDLIEYGLLIGIITLACVLAMTSIGGKVAAYFTSLNSAMP
jgi:Flp pilus assembly pilin Flp